MDNVERINTRKRNTITIVQCKITYEFHRFIDNSNDFYLVTKWLMTTKNSAVKIQNLIVKSNPG